MANISVNKKTLLTAKTTATAGSPIANPAVYKTFSASGSTSAGAGAATIVIEGSMNGGASYDDPIGTISLTLGTTVASSGFTSTDRYETVRARVTAISGTNASVDCAVGF